MYAFVCIVVCLCMRAYVIKSFENHKGVCWVRNRDAQETALARKERALATRFVLYFLMDSIVDTGHLRGLAN